MHIISRKQIKEFWEKHPTSEPSLRSWLKIANSADFHDRNYKINEVKMEEQEEDIWEVCVDYRSVKSSYYVVSVSSEDAKEQVRGAAFYQSRHEPSLFLSAKRLGKYIATNVFQQI